MILDKSTGNKIFLEISGVAAHLRGMQPTSSIDKDIPAIKEKLKAQNSNINRTHK